MKDQSSRLVVVESPYAGEVEENIRYARRAVFDSLHRGEAPLASHLLYTQDGILNDAIPEERALGVAAAHAWTPKADAVVVYVDRGLSRGMRAGVRVADLASVDVAIRSLETELTESEIQEYLRRLRSSCSL